MQSQDPNLDAKPKWRRARIWLLCIEFGGPESSSVGSDPRSSGNLNEDPIFVSPTLRNFWLQIGSNCIDAGNDFLIAFDVLDIDHDGSFGELTPIDLGEGPRQLDNNLTPDTGIPDGGGDGIVDMGVFETRIDAQ